MSHSLTGASTHGIPQASPPPEDLLDPGIKPMSPALAGGFFATSTTWKAHSQ